jgi:hypothetical protein
VSHSVIIVIRGYETEEDAQESAVGAYEWWERELSMLSDEEREAAEEVATLTCFVARDA